MEGEIVQVVRISPKMNVMHLVSIESKAHRAIIGTGAHVVGEFLWMTRNGEDIVLQKLVNHE